MTKLSARVPDSFDEDAFKWLKELAQSVERKENVLLWHQEQIILLTKSIKDLDEQAEKTIEKVETKYQPQTYDEAIALIKGWKRYVEGPFVHWETPKGAWWVIDPNDEVGFCEADYENYNFSWERNKWPDLWKEMFKDGKVDYLYLADNKWILNCVFMIRSDSTPGRVVCKAYLVYKGHPDWAERLSKVEVL